MWTAYRDRAEGAQVAGAASRYTQAADDDEMICRADGHDWPQLDPRKPMPWNFRPGPIQPDGSFAVTEICGRCRKRRKGAVLPGGFFDEDGRCSYRDPDNWHRIPRAVRAGRRAWRSEQYRRMNEPILAAARQASREAENIPQPAFRPAVAR